MAQRYRPAVTIKGAKLQHLLRRVILKVVAWSGWLVFAWALSILLVSATVLYVRYSAKYNLLGSTAGVAIIQAVQLILLLAILIIPLYRRGKNKQLSKAKRRSVKMQLLGLGRLPERSDLAFLLAGIVTYYFVASGVILLASLVLPNNLIIQQQQTGFATTGNTIWQSFIIVFLLVMVAPMGEELIFRGFLYGKLRQLAPAVPMALVVSALFATAHGQINVGIATFILSLISCGLREKTGSIWSSVGLHMVVNLVAVYLVYLMPLW